MLPSKGGSKNALTEDERYQAKYPGIPSWALRLLKDLQAVQRDQKERGMQLEQLRKEGQEMMQALQHVRYLVAVANKR